MCLVLTLCTNITRIQGMHFSSGSLSIRNGRWSRMMKYMTSAIQLKQNKNWEIYLPSQVISSGLSNLFSLISKYQIQIEKILIDLDSICSAEKNTLHCLKVVCFFFTWEYFLEYFHKLLGILFYSNGRKKKSKMVQLYHFVASWYCQVKTKLTE